MHLYLNCTFLTFLYRHIQHETCATDTGLIKEVINDVKVFVMKEALQDIGKYVLFENGKLL